MGLKNIKENPKKNPTGYNTQQLPGCELLRELC